MNNDILVNKNNKLDSNFIPPNMIKIYEPTDQNLDPSYVNMLVKEAYINYKYMQKYALNFGYNIFIDSSYRSYEYQEMIYNYYLNKYGIDYVNSFVAVPGSSEHQTGLAIDIIYKRNDLFVPTNEKDEEIKWLIDNSYKFGYILRYPRFKEDITGYNYEPWHYRYVGNDLSKYIFENNLTLEEYHEEMNLKKRYY